jgi:hypothetical protein
MPASLEYCLRTIEDLERRITDLELSASRKAPVAPPPLQRIHRPEMSETVLKPDAIYLVLRFEQDRATPPVSKVQVQAALEQMPRVCEQIKLLWFYPECEQLLDKLIIDDRGNRRGFRREVMDELLFLARLSRAVKMNHSLSPIARKPEQNDVWQGQRPERRAS